MGEARSTVATVQRLAAPIVRNAPRVPMTDGATNGAGDDGAPTSRRLHEVLLKHDVGGERAIALAQGAIALFILTLHIIAQVSQRFDVPGADAGPYAASWASPWVVL